ncbi:MAG: ATP-dependent DNA ligase, partial [Actinomycetota bacterium]
YEPKWDGFRAIVFRDGDEIYIASRDQKPLERYFPEMVEPLKKALPDRCVVDGEIVITHEDGLDFDAMLLRIHPAKSRVDMLAKEHPASFVAFDLLALNEADLCGAPVEERRASLESIFPPVTIDQVPPSLSVVLTPHTDSPTEGERWFNGMESLGLDGIIAKREGTTYSPGKRTMVKVKHLRTADCVVGGYRLNKSKDGIGSLLLGLYDDKGTLHYIGHTSSFKAKERREVLAQLKQIEGPGGFGEGRTPGGPSRWTGAQGNEWFPVKPVLVCEVTYDFLQGDRFRHAAGFVRWRDDKKPSECDFSQL